MLCGIFCSKEVSSKEELLSLVFQIPCEDRCLDPQTPLEKAFRGSKYLFTRYLGDFGRLGCRKRWILENLFRDVFL